MQPFKNVLLVILITGFSAASSAKAKDYSNALASVELNKNEMIATVCSSVKIFKSNEYFYHAKYNGYVIKISGENSIFEGLKGQVCLVGPYRIDSKGFAPQLLISDVQVIQSVDAVSESISNQLQNIVSDIATTWGDNNISTGTTQLTQGQLTQSASEEKLKNSNEAALRKYLAEHADLDSATLTVASTATGNFADENILFVAKVLALGNAYSPQNVDGLRNFQKDLKVLIAALGKKEEISTTISALNYEKDGETRDVYSILFVNKTSLQTLNIFVIEGTM